MVKNANILIHGYWLAVCLKVGDSEKSFGRLVTKKMGKRYVHETFTMNIECEKKLGPVMLSKGHPCRGDFQ